MSLEYASVNAVYERVKTLMNKQQMGMITPLQANTLFPQAQQELVNEKISEIYGSIKYVVNRIGFDSEAVKRKATDDIRTLEVRDVLLHKYTTLTLTAVSGTFTDGEEIVGGSSGATGEFVSYSSGTMVLWTKTGTFITSETITGGTSGETATTVTATVSNIKRYPSDYSRLINLEDDDNIVTIVDDKDLKYFRRSRYSANSSYALAALHPSTIESIPNASSGTNLYMNYYKIPQGSVNGVPSTSQPSWAYTQVGEDLLYNSATSVDFELPKHMEEALVNRMLSLVGLTLRDQMPIQYAETQLKEDVK